jgi:hypothetical protein
MNKFKVLAVTILLFVGVASILYSVNWDKIGKAVSKHQREVVYIGGHIGDGAIGYNVYKLNRHGLCYELFRRGNSESFIINVKCGEGDL